MEKEITTILVTNRLTEVDLNTVTNKTWLSTYGILIWRKDRLESDCLSFIIQVLGGDKKSRSINDSNFEYRWWVLLHSVKTLNPWDVILLHTWTEEWLDAWEYHVALYLWDSIFLSKAWEQWHILASTLEQLELLYPMCTDKIKFLLKRKS